MMSFAHQTIAFKGLSEISNAPPFGLGQERGLREQFTTKTSEFALLVAS
jgi:hypothetical protein